MAKPSSSNLSRERLQSRRLANNPNVRQATRDNKKPRKQMPSQNLPDVAASPKKNVINQDRQVEQADRVERMQQIPAPVPKQLMQQQEQPMSQIPKLDLPPISSFSEPIQKEIKELVLMSVIEQGLREQMI